MHFILFVNHVHKMIIPRPFSVSGGRSQESRCFLRKFCSQKEPSETILGLRREKPGGTFFSQKDASDTTFGLRRKRARV